MTRSLRTRPLRFAPPRGGQAQAVAFGGRIERAREPYRETVEIAQRQGFRHVAQGYASQAAWTEALYGNDRRAVGQAREVLLGDLADAVRLRAAATVTRPSRPRKRTPARRRRSNGGWPPAKTKT